MIRLKKQRKIINQWQVSPVILEDRVSLLHDNLVWVCKLGTFYLNLMSGVTLLMCSCVTATEGCPNSWLLLLRACFLCYTGEAEGQQHGFL